jgi:hypothetical protein
MLLIEIFNKYPYIIYKIKEQSQGMVRSELFELRYQERFQEEELQGSSEYIHDIDAPKPKNHKRTTHIQS